MSITSIAIYIHDLTDAPGSSATIRSYKFIFITTSKGLKPGVSNHLVNTFTNLARQPLC